jgi:hypothetical protein
MAIEVKNLKTLIQINLKAIMKSEFNVTKYYIKSIKLTSSATYHGVYASDKLYKIDNLPDNMNFIIENNENWSDKYDFINVFDENAIDTIKITNIVNTGKNLDREVDHPKQENI